MTPTILKTITPDTLPTHRYRAVCVTCRRGGPGTLGSSDDLQAVNVVAQAHVRVWGHTVEIVEGE